jgi:hypothetical protein
MACTAPTIIVGGVLLSTSDFQNARDIISNVSGDLGDPTLDEHTENIANGNNTAGTSGIQLPNASTDTLPTQTTLPPPIPQKPEASNDIPPPGGNGVPVSSDIWSGDYDQYLSPNFKVRDFTINAVFPYQLTDYNSTYTAQVRFDNLKALAVNVAEPLRAALGNININSGLRNITSASSGLSQHVKGQAFDAQFTGWSYERYWENASWIKDNIKYDQFIFEHSSVTGLAWYHLSFNTSGNRAANDPNKVLTMYKNNYSPGLKKYG